MKTTTAGTLTGNTRRISSTSSSRGCNPRPSRPTRAPSAASASTSISRLTLCPRQQLTDYFTDLVASHSWSTVKLDLYGLKFYYAHVLRKPWVAPGLIKPPRASACRTSSRRGGQAAVRRHPRGQLPGVLLHPLQPGTAPGRRAAPAGGRYRCGTRARAYPRRQGQPGSLRAPAASDPQLLQRFWQVHRNPVLLFPNRHGGVKARRRATTPMDPGGVQTTLHKVVQTCGLKKRSRPTACATAMPPT